MVFDTATLNRAARVLRSVSPELPADAALRRELAAEEGIPTVETHLQSYDLATADEVFFTSTPYCIMPATRFNGLTVGDGKVGPITRRLLAAWSRRVGLDIVGQAESQLRAG